MADWRWKLLQAINPGGYSGFFIEDWLTLLRGNGDWVSPSHVVRDPRIWICPDELGASRGRTTQDCRFLQQIGRDQSTVCVEPLAKLYDSSA